MTVSTTKNRINQSADGSQTVFIYDFLVQEESQMNVYLDDVLQSTGYTVNGVGNDAGGDVTFDVAPANGVTVTLQRIVEETQEVDYLPYDPFPAETHEGALDKLTLITQQNSDIGDRAAVAPVSDDGTTDYTMPAYDAGKGIMWDETDKKFTNSDYDLNETSAGDINTVKKTSNTGAALMPSGTTAERDATTKIGMQRFNTDLGQSEEWDGANWISSGGATGAGGDAVFYENDQTVNNDYTITANKNAMSAGDITIASGVTVTVPTGSKWTVV